jgi:hypothetical protein
MVNPIHSGSFSPFKIEVMDGESSIILEKIEFLANITILPR